MINPSINFIKVFREQVQKYLGYYFSIKAMKTIKFFPMKNNTSVMALIMIYENNGKYTKTVYRVLSCVVYTLMDNYIFIDYLSCQSKTLRNISSDPTFKEKVSIYYLVLAF